MANTHSFELKIDADRTYTGQLELTSSGAITVDLDNPLSPMIGTTEHSVHEIFKAVGNIFAAHGKLKKLLITTLDV